MRSVAVTFLQKHAGNARTLQRLNLQRDSPDDAVSLDARQYVAVSSIASQIGKDFLAQMASIDFPTGSPFATWAAANSMVFVTLAMKQVASADGQMWKVLSDTLSPSSPEPPINRGRDADEWGHGPPTYKPAVAEQLRNVYRPQLAASLQRVLPRYLLARNQALLHAESASRQSFKVAPEPAVDDVITSHPLDIDVLAALRAGTVSFDAPAYQRAHPDERAIHDRAQLREVTLAFETTKGLTSWVRVIGPQEAIAVATAEDVALALFGSSSHANLLTPAAPLFGFTVGSVPLVDHYETEWQKTVNAATPGQGHPVVDPVQEMLASPGGTEAALNQAKDLKFTGASKDEIVLRLRLIVTNFDDAIEQAKTFGQDRQLLAARARVDQRSKQVHDSGQVEEALKWDAQSFEQLQVVAAGVNGIRLAAEQFKSMNVSPDDVGGVDSVPHYVRQPLYSLAVAYVDAVASSDLVGTAKTKLAAADEKAKTYPVDVMDGILQFLRTQLERAKSDKTTVGLGGDANYGISALQERERLLRTRVDAAREALISDPQAAKKVLAEIQKDLQELQGETTAVTNLDSIDTMWGLLFDHISFFGVMTGKNTDYGELMGRLNKHWGEWRHVKNLYEVADPGAKDALDNAQKNAPKLVADLNEMEETFKTRERREGYLKLAASLLAMIAIGLVTAGIGTFVEGGLIGAGWSAAGFGSAAALGTTLTVTFVENVTFTLMSQVILGSDPDSNIVKDFFTNWAMLGFMKGLGSAYKTVVGAKFAATTGGKVIGAVAIFEALTGAALLKKSHEKKALGQDLTRDEALMIIFENAAMVIGTAVGEYCAGGLFETLKAHGSAFGARFKAVDAVREGVGRQAEIVQKTRSIKQAQALLEKHRELVTQEQKLLEDIDLALKEGDSAPEGRRLTPEERVELGARRAEITAGIAERKATAETAQRSAIQLELQHRKVGYNRYLLEAGRFNTVTEALRGLGDTVGKAEVDPVTGAETVAVEPKDHGSTYHITKTESAEFSSALNDQAATGGAAADLSAPKLTRQETSRRFDDAADKARALASSPEADPTGEKLRELLQSEPDEVLAQFQRKGNPLERAMADALMEQRLGARDELPEGIAEPPPAAPVSLKELQQHLINALGDPALVAQFRDTPIHVVSEAEFAQFKSGSADAVTIFKTNARGEPVPEIYFKENGNPMAIREEATHVAQAADKSMAGKLAELSEQNLSDWAKMDLPKQLELYRTKIEVEIDGQRRLLKQVKQGGGNVEELAEVEGSLAELRERLAAVKEAIRNPEAASKKMPEWWDPTQPPRLFWKPRLPRTGGRWDGPPGNSRWFSDHPLVKKLTGGKGILFRNRYPVFSNPKWSADSVQIEMSGMADDFSAADKVFAEKNGWLKPNGEPNISESARWRRDNGYTWHHHQSGKTMILVLTDLHANVPHSGGACLARGVE